ncbi:MAG: B12-binding domain-containing radical SAM protein [Sandaracinaceae bacterium]|nr:B12-binding domain-containing radical SAM protein [Sandaracinaceae bacterium]
MVSPHVLRVALVGPVMQENLALQYLSAVVRERGHTHRLVGYDRRDELTRAVRDVIAFEPDLVGIATPFQFTIADTYAIARALRDAGCRAHLTCGGHVPTFCYAEMLRDCEALDSIVRHEGEETLGAMLDALEQGRPIADLDGLVWRDGTGIAVAPRREPVRQLDAISPPLRPSDPYRVGGVPVGFVITARGCIGECDYCSIRAFGRDAGGAPFRLRGPEHVADELATLHHQHGARVFFVQDDIFVLPSERKTIERMGALRDALSRRGVRDVAFWIKGRPETITEPVLEAARAMGAIHLFMGVESASAARLAYLGRLHQPHHNREALARCRAHGIHPSFNFMLFDPDCALEDVAETLRFAQDNVGLPFNYCRTEIYSGTGLLDRLRDEGRLLGDYRSYGYVMRDPRAELMFRVLRVCLHERAFAYDSLLNKLISLSFARQIHLRFFPGPRTDAMDRAVDALMAAAHEDTLRILWAAHDLAARDGDNDERRVRDLALELAFDAGQRDLPWHVEAQQLWDTLNVTGIHLTAHQASHRPDQDARAPAS